VAYAVKAGNKQFVVVDGIEAKQYDDIGLPSFSPKSNHLTYFAKKGAKWLVVVDKTEENQYDTIYGGSPIFDSPDSLHYLAKNGNSIYLVRKVIE
jgi:hypothetical protein